MRSVREIFVIGHGPSSSHTMGPANACKYIINKYKNAEVIIVFLYGSLASTGKGHFTDLIIDEYLKDIPHHIIFDTKHKSKHPNTMVFKITCKDDKTHVETVISIGGGTILTAENVTKIETNVYNENCMDEILDYCDKRNISLVEYILEHEEKDILDYMEACMKAMLNAAKEGVSKTGELPGTLHIQRKANAMYQCWKDDIHDQNKIDAIMATAALAVSETNASAGVVVIAPTCGSCGVIPGCIAYLEAYKYPKKKILEGMLVAALIGMLCKTNASIAGAEAGCQAEIGVACAMGAGMIAYVKGNNNRKIAQAAEIALEHSLGLTCDPVAGYVQIPCIERNAMYALKARDAVTIAELIPNEYGKISFDDSVKTMYQTGLDMRPGYKETSKKGLAKLFKKNY